MATLSIRLVEMSQNESDIMLEYIEWTFERGERELFDI